MGLTKIKLYRLAKITESTTWMTPLVQLISAFVTFAESIMTLPSLAAILTDFFATVMADGSFATSAAITLPATT